MNYKKGLLYGCVLGLVVFGASYREWYPTLRTYLKQHAESFITENLMQSVSVKTTRDIPEDIDITSYLAGMFAKETGAYKEATQYYAKVLEKDPAHPTLKSELFILYAITGQIDKAIQLTDDLNDSNKYTFFINQIKLAGWIKQGEYQKVINFYKSSTLSASDIILKPLLLTWSYAGLNKPQEAFNVLSTIDDKRLEGVKLYHQALLSDYFGKKLEAQAIYRDFKTEQLTSANALISITEMFKETSEWQPGNPLYDKYVMFLQEKPVLLDIITQVGSTPIKTPQQAIADAFYTVALSFADLKLTERAALLNNIALYLDNESNLYKIGVAELYQNMEMYQAANDAYDAIQPMTDIIRFKKSLNLMKSAHYTEALELLQILEPHNKTNPLIQQIIAEAYRETGNYSKAIERYTHAINLLKANGRWADVANIQLMLAKIYYDQNNAQKMFEILEQAILNNSKDPFALNFLGYELIDRDINAPRGLQLVSRANLLLPDDAHIMDSVAWGYYKLKEYNKALEYSEKANKKEKSNAVILIHLGDIYQALGRGREAKAQYRKALAAKKELTPQVEAQLKQKLGETEVVSNKVTETTSEESPAE